MGAGVYRCPKLGQRLFSKFLTGRGDFRGFLPISLLSRAYAYVRGNSCCGRVMATVLSRVAWRTYARGIRQMDNPPSIGWLVPVNSGVGMYRGETFAPVSGIRSRVSGLPVRSNGAFVSDLGAVSAS
jgi:hypothetical protein